MPHIYDVYIPVNVLKLIYAHFSKEAENRREALGLLLGQVRTYENKIYTYVTGYITAENSATSVHVSFNKDAFSKLACQYSKTNRVIVGWAHSHPTFGCFLSSTDIQTQKDLFNQEFNVAMVVDPNRRENGFLQTRFYKLETTRNYREVSFAVIKDE